MNRNLSESNLSQNRFQTDSNFSLIDSCHSPACTSKCSGHKFDSPKMFQRKPTFKIFQRKDKRQTGQHPKITYISPQKSQIFKKYVGSSQNFTQLNLSMLTDNSNDVLRDIQTKRSHKPLSLLLDLNDSRSVLNQINNLKPDNGFMTPKNTKNEMYWSSPSNLKKSLVNKLKNQEQTVANQQTDFNIGFNTLNQIRQPTFGFYTSTKLNYCQSQSKSSRIGSNIRKQNCSPQILEALPLDSRIKSIDQQVEIEKLKIQCNKLKVQKAQIQDSSRIFLEQIKALQHKLHSEIEQKAKALKKSTELKQILIQKERKIEDLNSQIKALQEVCKSNKLHEQAENDHLKAMYFQLSQKLKYMSVQNGILKKMLEQKRDQTIKIQRLQNLNKRLTSRNKFLTKALQQIQTQTNDPKKQITPKKNNKKLNSQNDKINSRKGQIRQNLCKSPIKKSGSMNFQKDPELMELNLSKVRFKIQDEDKFSIISNNSELELSFELSPQKNHWPKLNETPRIRQLRTANVLN